MKPTLNELPASQWVRWNKSWFTHPSPARDALKRAHPAPFPETLARECIEFFTHPHDWVLDPMCGTGSTILAALQTERNAIGYELSDPWYTIAQQRINSVRNLFQSTEARLYHADCRTIHEHHHPPIHLVLTSPPYWNILHRTQQTYSTDPRDFGNIEDYPQFLNELVRFYESLEPLLNPNAHLVIIAQNFKIQSDYYPFAWELALKLQETYRLKQERIWCIENTPLRAYGYPTTYVGQILHRYLLILQKR